MQDNQPIQKIPPSLSIIMPVYNEQDVIGKVVEDFCKVLEKFSKPEFVIVDDCSSDNTPEILKSLEGKYPYLRIITNEANSGHGPSLVRAYKESAGKYIFHCDSDNQFYAEDFWLLWNKMRESGDDAVIGKRHNRQDARHRLFITKMLRVLLAVLLGADIKDANSPFKLHKRVALNKIIGLVPENAFVPSILMAMVANKLKMKTGYVNVRHLPRLTGSTFIKSWKIFKICLKSTREILAFKKGLKNI
ncbi:glycosyltransferase family 2 protein [Patescibacteria group bacterium]|nr:glycosyltransferase family 2 protein [Patescibacteria group bacterium]